MRTASVDAFVRRALRSVRASADTGFSDAHTFVAPGMFPFQIPLFAEVYTIEA